MTVAGGPFSARRDAGFGTSKTMVHTTSSSSAVGSTCVLRKTLSRLAQDLGQAQLKWAEQIAEGTATPGIPGGVELATSHARKLCMREERSAHLRGLEAASGCLRRGIAHGTSISRSNGHSEKEAARLAEENMLLRRRADMMLARMTEPARAEDSVALIEEELTAVRESAAGEAARLRKVAEANGESELERARAHVLTLELESDKKSVSLSERLAASLKATLLEGSERYSEAAYLQGEQEDARRQSELMERRLTQLRRRNVEANKALKNCEEQVTALNDKTVSLQMCRHADEEARRRKIASRVKHREAAEMWIEHQSVREQALVLATEVRECANSKRVLEHQEQNLCEELVTLRAQTDTAKCGLQDSIRDAVLAAQHAERVAAKQKHQVVRTECEQFQLEAHCFRTQANRTREELQKVEDELAVVSEASLIQQLTHEASAEAVASTAAESEQESKAEEAHLQDELDEIRLQTGFERLEIRQDAHTTKSLRVESDELHSFWMMQEEHLMGEQKRAHERLQEEMEVRAEARLQQQKDEWKYKELCKQLLEQCLSKVKQSEEEIEDTRKHECLRTEYEVETFTRAEEEYHKRAEEAARTHALKMERQEGQLMHVSGSLALAGQLLIQTDLEIVELQDACPKQEEQMYNSREKCRRLRDANEAEQAIVQRLHKYEWSLLRQREEMNGRINDFSKARSNLSQFIQANARRCAFVAETVEKEREVVSRLRARLDSLRPELESHRATVAHHPSQMFPEQEEALRAEARAFTLELSEMEASLDAAIALRKARSQKSRSTCRSRVCTSGTTSATRTGKGINSPRVAAGFGVTNHRG